MEVGPMILILSLGPRDFESPNMITYLLPLIAHRVANSVDDYASSIITYLNFLSLSL